MYGQIPPPVIRSVELLVITQLEPHRVDVQWHPTPVFLPGKSHGWRILEGCSPWGCWGSDTTERFHFHFSISCVGEGNGNPLQCSCLENPRDGGAWWAAICGVTQSQTRLKWLSSSSRVDDIYTRDVNQLKFLIYTFTLTLCIKAKVWK